MLKLSLFKSRATRELEAKIRFRQGKSRIHRFLQELCRSADKYWHLARQAYQLGDEEQLRQLASHYLRARTTINRWERFLVKLDALEMRRNEVEATGEFLGSMSALTESILRGASPEELTRLQTDIERALHKSQAQEEMLDLAMEAAGQSLFSEDGPSTEVMAQITAGLKTDVTQPTDTPDPADRHINQLLRNLDGIGSTTTP